MFFPTTISTSQYLQACSPCILLKPMQDLKGKICSYPLANRVTQNWQVLLLGASTAIAISGLAFSLISGSLLSSAVFFVLSISSAIGAVATRKYALLNDLQTTTANLKETNAKLQGAIQNLEAENTRLANTSRELQNTTFALQVTNRNIEQANQQLGLQVNSLTGQVSQLQLQLFQLSESAQRIHEEVNRFQGQNNLIANNGLQIHQSLRILDREIKTSQAICAQIAAQMEIQQQGLGLQLQQLGAYIAQLGAENGILSRIHELNLLRDQIQQAAGQLYGLRAQFERERAEFNTIQQAMQQLRGEFQQVLGDAANRFGANNTKLEEIARQFADLYRQRNGAA